jgi:hypothetical protein
MQNLPARDCHGAQKDSDPFLIYMIRHLFILVLACLCVPVVHSEEKGATTQQSIRVEFTPSGSKIYDMNRACAFVVPNPEKEGAALLKIDTTKSAGSLMTCLKTLVGVLKPDTDYIIQARARIVQREEENTSFVIYAVRPFSGGGGVYDIDQTFGACIGRWENILLRFHVPKGVPNAAFQIQTRGKVVALLDDLTIRETKLDSEMVADKPLSPAQLPSVLPKGAEEFPIDLPRTTGGAVVSVADFGASVNSPDNTKAFSDAAAHCAATGASKLVVPKGTYRFTSDEPVRFDHLKDFEFDGGGSTFVFLKGHNNLIEITKSERVLFKDFSIDWDWDKVPLASVVKVELVALGGEYVDLRFVDYVKYPRKDIHVVAMDSMDPALMIPGNEKFFRMFFEFSAGKTPAKVEWQEDNLLRLYAEEKKAVFLENLRPGQLYRMKHFYYEMKALAMIDNSHMTLSGV